MNLLHTAQFVLLNLFSSEKIGGELPSGVDIVYVWCSSAGNVVLASVHSLGPIT